MDLKHLESSTQFDSGEERRSAQDLSRYNLWILAAIAIVLCAALAAPFTPAITWSIALAVVSHPLHAWIKRRIPERSELAAVLATGTVALGLLAPIVFVAQQLAQEAKGGMEQMQSLVESGDLRQQLESDPFTARVFHWLEANVDVNQELKNLSGAFGRSAGRWIEGAAWTATQLLITIFLLFYLFRDRETAIQSLRSYLPLTGEESNWFLERVRSMIHATLFGTLTVALLQGVLGGLIFWILGIPGALLWGAVMAMTAIIPVAGTFIVWVPAAAILAGQGSWGKAAILTAWGLLVVSLVDNLLYPMLVGKEIQIHTALVFMAIAGGLILFGISGLVIGPVLLVVALALIDVIGGRRPELN